MILRLQMCATLSRLLDRVRTGMWGESDGSGGAWRVTLHVIRRHQLQTCEPAVQRTTVTTAQPQAAAVIPGISDIKQKSNVHLPPCIFMNLGRRYLSHNPLPCSF